MIKTEKYTVHLGGMDDRVVPAKDTARLITDLQWCSEGFWEPVWGVVEVSNFAVDSGPISAIHWFQPRPNQRWLITERRIDSSTSRLAYVDFPAGGTPTAIADRRRLDSDDLGTQFMDMGRWCWMLSPIDGLFRWDGERVVRVGFNGPAPQPIVQGPLQGGPGIDVAGFDYGTPTAPTDTNQRGVGEFDASADAKWVYVYGLTEVNDLGQEGPMSPLTAITGHSDNTLGRFPVLVQVPMSAVHVQARRLWRSRNLVGVDNPDQGTAMYLLKEYTGAFEFDYLDLSEDTELQVLFDGDRVGPVPLGARAMGSWAGVSWLGGMAETPHRLVYSTPGRPEQFGPLSYIDIGTQATGPIVALHPIPRGMLVFKTGGIFVVKGDVIQGFRADEVDITKGTSSPRAIVTHPRLGVLFLDPASGPHAVVGSLSDDQPTSVQPIGAGIRKFWNRRSGVLLNQAVAVYDPGREEVWWHIPEGGNPRPTIGLVLHTSTGQWSVRPDWDIGAFEFYRGRIWIGSHDDTTAAGVWLLTAGSRDKLDGTEISGSYTTNPLRLDDRQWLFMWIEGIGLALGRAPWSVSTRTDRSRETVLQSEAQLRQLQHTHDRPVWGLAKWDAGDFDDYDVSRFPVSSRVPLGFEHQLRITSSRFRMAHLELIVPSGPTLPITPKTQERR